MIPERTDLLYADPEGKLAILTPRPPELSVQGRFVFVAGESQPIAEVPEGLLFDPPIDPKKVTAGGKYAPANRWVRRNRLAEFANVVMDEVLQQAKSTQVARENLPPAYDSVVPGGLYVVRLTEVARRSGLLRAARIRRVLTEAYGQPTAQFRFIYSMESGEERMDWVGVWQKPGGKTARGPLPPRRGSATSR